MAEAPRQAQRRDWRLTRVIELERVVWQLYLSTKKVMVSETIILG